MNLRRCSWIAILFLMLAACKDPVPDTKPLPKVFTGLKLVPDDGGPGLQIAVSLPPDVDPRPVVTAISTLMYRAMRTCAKTKDGATLTGQLVIALTIDGDEVRDVQVPSSGGTDCWQQSLLSQRLSKSLGQKVELKLIIEPMASD